MRLYTNTLRGIDLFEAARIARVDFDYDEHGSRTTKRVFNVRLNGESKRRPNFGHGHLPAATWDQWGVFFAVLFDRDPYMRAGGTVKRPAYADRAHFHRLTNNRFRPVGIVSGDTPGALAVVGDPDYDGTVLGPVFRQERTYWPTDAHGDHTFRYAGTPREQQCIRCSAVLHWES